MSGLNREFANNKVEFGILEKVDRDFLDLRRTLDTVNSELHRDGIGVSTKHASTLSKEDEDMCWTKGTVSFSTLIVLQHTVFFYMGLHFVLRGVQEHYDFLVSQLQRVPADVSVYSDKVYYEYTEYISKNNLHRFTDHKMKNKVVRAYAQPDSDRCLVAILDRYIALLDPDAKHMYMHPKQSCSSDGSPAYTRQRVGVNTIKKFPPKITTLAGINGFTNHSLRATAMSRMYNSGVPEKIIAEKSGHRSIDGLRAYEHPDEELFREVIIDPTKKFSSTKSTGDKEEPIPKIEDVASNPQIPGFSGLSNCTFHFSINTYTK